MSHTLMEPDDILRDYILSPKVSIHDPDLQIIPRVPNPRSVITIPDNVISTTIRPIRDPLTNQIIDFEEVTRENAESTAKNSMSLQRKPDIPSHATRGSASNYPFWPGGFDMKSDEQVNEHISDELSMMDRHSFNRNEFLNTPPGFDNGLDFGGNNYKEMAFMETVDLIASAEAFDAENINLTVFEKIPEERIIEEMRAKCNESSKTSDELLDTKFVGETVLDISKTEGALEKSLKWAEKIDISQPVNDFEVRVPEPAHTYDFELDTFQKQAILKLEEHCHVFVAAHTSAGKTVVAEYAIALSQRHMTRSIYTSPIKALSNQKYRDFKKTFKDVGLITGDIQIDPTSSCLIMTTEILKSMLYGGSDVIRDLEYVIFDEVHYINDADRGHVWEEVLILLPDHVNIVMLSATVPNTLEFANWVGETKRRKVYVVSTLKRPVPLMHYLYTGTGGKSKNDNFLIVNDAGEFLMKGYKEAAASRDTNSKDGNKAKMIHVPGKMNPRQEQTMWEGLIDYLKRNDKLPVVAFTLSRNRCDRNMNALKSCDLCTAKESNLIHLFFNQCLQKLKPPDRQLPQVLTLQDSLKRGIGVHHSGILPVLKEIVEMLFQENLVKLLFATETFAMGVNMPARTVIFDSHIKYDGQKSRVLQPAEYTQMAGRAGRRGKDKNGTVILLCKGNIPSEQELRSMILGKPMRLESRFRLTYATILNLLRVESSQVSVEDMISHSFLEFDTQKKVPENRDELKRVEEQLQSMSALGPHLKDLCRFYDCACNFLRIWNRIAIELLTQSRVIKELKPGRVLIVSQDKHYSKLGALLTITSNHGKEPTYKVLVLDHAQRNNEGDEAAGNFRGDLWNSMLALSANYKHFEPLGIGGHTILTLKASNILAITKSSVKVEADKIIQNWEQRQIPRFRDTPPGPSCVKSVGELTALNDLYKKKPKSVDIISVTQDVTMKKDVDIFDYIHQLNAAKRELDEIVPVTKTANFKSDFGIVFDRKEMERKRNELQYKVSKESLSLYPDYQNKLGVLQRLKYINEQNEVTMKGRVACEMGSNELMITELVLHNVFTELPPAEIAALLSCLVFEAKTETEPEIKESLKKCIDIIMDVDEQISNVERECNVTSQDDALAKDRLNFGLVEVVYEWANNKPFAEIMKLTDIQEGIIVRCIQQLYETLRDVKDAARIIGNPALHSKMEEASNAIKRDIVFAPSLYTQTTK